MPLAVVVHVVVLVHHTPRWSHLAGVLVCLTRVWTALVVAVEVLAAVFVYDVKKDRWVARLSLGRRSLTAQIAIARNRDRVTLTGESASDNPNKAVGDLIHMLVYDVTSIPIQE